MLVSYRSGEMSPPKLDVTEALQVEAQHFAGCIQNGTTPITDGEVGLRVVSVLEAATRSIPAGRSVQVESSVPAHATWHRQGYRTA